MARLPLLKRARLGAAVVAGWLALACRPPAGDGADAAGTETGSSEGSTTGGETGTDSDVSSEDSTSEGPCEPGTEGYTCEDGSCAGDLVCVDEVCAAASCGDGVLSAGEECDDGNQAAGDGCDAACQWQPAVVVQVVAGVANSCALTQDGRVLCWGGYAYGALGQEKKEDVGSGTDQMGVHLPATDLGKASIVQQIALGGHHACARFDDGRLKCWGSNAAGQLGVGHTDPIGDDPGEMGDALSFVDLAGTEVASVCVGGVHTCALADDGQVNCWGSGALLGLGLSVGEYVGDEPGEMGDALASVDVGGDVVQLACGRFHTCALLDDGRVKCWGDGAGGKVGLGDGEIHGDEPGEMGADLSAVDVGGDVEVVEVVAGPGSSCIRDVLGRVKCWGVYHSLGIGAGADDHRGDEPGEMGDALPWLDFGVGRAALALVPGATCAVLDDATLKCWGPNTHGELGQGHTNWIGDDPGEMGDALAPLDFSGEAVIGGAVGNQHACAILESGRVKCWGDGYSGALGQGDQESRGDEPGEMGGVLPYIEL